LALSRIDEAKRSLAQKMRPIRSSVHKSSGRTVAVEICEQLAQAQSRGLVINDGAIASAYWPIRDELDPRKLMNGLHGRGVRCALPIMQGREKALAFRRWQPGDVLEETTFGVAQPTGDKPSLIPEIIFVPLLAIDNEGNRLGYGAGYYDRTIQERRQGRSGPVVAVGIAYEAQRVSAVPHDERDARLDWLITEDAVYRFGNN